MNLSYKIEQRQKNYSEIVLFITLVTGSLSQKREKMHTRLILIK